MVETTGETRRSTRIAAQPKKEEPKQVKLAKKPSKKRTAEAADADGDVAESSKVATEAPANKKVRLLC